jgi:hypothetical protein
VVAALTPWMEYCRVCNRLSDYAAAAPPDWDHWRVRRSAAILCQCTKWQELDVTTQFRRYDEGFFQTRILVDGVRFPEQIEVLDVLNRRVNDRGGDTAWRALVTNQKRRL